MTYSVHVADILWLDAWCDSPSALWHRRGGLDGGHGEPPVMASEGWAKGEAALRNVGMPPRCTRTLLQEDVSTIAVWMAPGRLGDEAESE